MDNDILTTVSRETICRLREFERLALKWTKKINLVSSNDGSQIWERHIVDSIQIYDLAPQVGDWLDIGSGGGFPGIVMAILAKADTPDRSFTLVDSDQRKCAFLRTVNRELELNITVFSDRVEEMNSVGAAVLSARAMTDLDGLLHHTERHLATNGVAIFPKGARWQEEDKIAKVRWNYDLKAVKSATNPDATILKIKELSRV